MYSKQMGTLALLAGVFAGCGTAAAVRTSRGTVMFSAASGARAIVAGPADLHAYEGFAGAEIYDVPATAGSDADCAAPAWGDTVEVPRDRVLHLTVLARRLVCVRTQDSGSHELLWHVVERPSADASVEVSAMLPRNR